MFPTRTSQRRGEGEIKHLDLFYVMWIPSIWVLVMFIDHVETYTQIFLRPLHNTLGLVLELLRHNPHSQLLRVVAIFWLVIHLFVNWLFVNVCGWLITIIKYLDYLWMFSGALYYLIILTHGDIDAANKHLLVSNVTHRPCLVEVV